MGEASLIHVDSIVTIFGNKPVHTGVSFQIDKPSIVALIGESGCGKSVLLREIIGLHTPHSGKVSLFGHDMHHADKLSLQRCRNQFGVLFQDGALFSALSVGENVAVPLREHTALSDQAIERIVELRLVLSGLSTSTAYKAPSELSGGMRKRVALARALALEPKLLFLDEPTSGLDPINARAFDELIRGLCDGLGLTVLLVTHDLDTLEGIVDRVIVLSGGQVLADGPVSQVAKIQHPWIQSYFSARAR